MLNGETMGNKIILALLILSMGSVNAQVTVNPTDSRLLRPHTGASVSENHRDFNIQPVSFSEQLVPAARSKGPIK
jgi:hypothetical protein